MTLPAIRKQMDLKTPGRALWRRTFGQVPVISVELEATSLRKLHENETVHFMRRTLWHNSHPAIGDVQFPACYHQDSFFVAVFSKEEKTVPFDTVSSLSKMKNFRSPPVFQMANTHKAEKTVPNPAMPRRMANDRSMAHLPILRVLIDLSLTI
jgi:hypothetical protein